MRGCKNVERDSGYGGNYGEAVPFVWGSGKLRARIVASPTHHLWRNHNHPVNQPAPHPAPTNQLTS